MKTTVDYRNNPFISISIYDVEEYPMHYHDDPEIIFVLKGSTTVHTSFYTIDTLEENQFLFINGTTIHNIEKRQQPCRIMSVHFNVSHMAEVYGLPKFSVFTIASFDEYTPPETIATLRDHILQAALEHFSPSSGESLSNAALDCYVYMVNHFQWYYYEDYILHNYPHRLPHSQVIRAEEVLTYLERHHKEKLTLSSVAAAHYLSKYYLSHLLKDTLGMSFQDLLNAIRLNISLYSLLGSQKSVDEIALDCGFSSGAYFRKAFQTHAKISLSAYRRRYGKRTIRTMAPKVREYSADEQAQCLAGYCRKYDPEKIEKPMLLPIPVQVRLRNATPAPAMALPESLHTLLLTPDALLDPRYLKDVLKGMDFRQVSVDARQFSQLYRAYGSWQFLKPISDLCGKYGAKILLHGVEPQTPVERAPNVRSTLAAAPALLETEESFLRQLQPQKAPQPQPHCDRRETSQAAVAAMGGNAPLYTNFGFRTKWYYLYYLLHQLEPAVLYADDSCIVTAEGNRIAIFCHNLDRQTAATKEIFLHLFDIACNYSILTYTVSADAYTEETLWESLGRPEPLSAHLKRTVRHSCFPQVSCAHSTAPYDLLRDIMVEPGQARLLVFTPAP